MPLSLKIWRGQTINIPMLRADHANAVQSLQEVFYDNRYEDTIEERCDTVASWLRNGMDECEPDLREEVGRLIEQVATGKLGDIARDIILALICHMAWPPMNREQRRTREIAKYGGEE